MSAQLHTISGTGESIATYVTFSLVIGAVGFLLVSVVWGATEPSE